MNSRIKELRISMKKSQEEFGKMLGLSKSGISDIESGRRNVTEQHIIMLKNNNVNETWLRTGEGEMFLPVDLETEIAKLTVQLLTEQSDSFKNRLISALARLSEEQWKLLAEIAEEITSKKESGVLSLLFLLCSLFSFLIWQSFLLAICKYNASKFRLTVPAF